METDEHLAAVERENHRFLAAARSSSLDAPVPSCPGWDLVDLVGHLGWVHRWVIGWLETGSRTRLPAPPEDAAVLDWFAEGIDALLDALGTIDPAATPATFVGPEAPGWWPRRQAHEAAVHRWDAERAIGAPAPIDTLLAVDGIDELLEVFLDRRLGPEVARGDGETIHLVASDANDAWLLTMAADGGRWEHVRAEATASADVTVRAPASDLLLVLWNRVDTDGLDVSGDVAVLENWRDAVRV